MLSVSGLTKKVATHSGGLTILKDIEFSIESGETLAVVGASGSGKSTLLSLMAGLDSPTSGVINMLGQDIAQMDEDQRAEFRAQNVGFVFQSFHLLTTLTALENVALPLELKSGKAPLEQASALLASVGLSDRADHYPNQLSGGEQQRVAIARAFAGEPRILFADEPTGNLDTHTGEHIADLLFELNQSQQTTLILVSHDAKLAARCERQIELSGGELIRDSARESAAKTEQLNA